MIKSLDLNAFSPNNLDELINSTFDKKQNLKAWRQKFPGELYVDCSLPKTRIGVIFGSNQLPGRLNMLSGFLLGKF